MSMSERDLDNMDADIEEALDNIEANDEVDPTPLVINAEAIPEGVTPTDFIDTMQQTGTTIIQDTNSGIDSIQYRATSGHTTVNPDTLPFSDPADIVEEEVVEEQPQLVPETETPEEVQQEILKQKEEQERQQVEQDRRRYLIAEAERKRKQARSFKHYYMTNNDLMILANGEITIKTDTQREGTIDKLHRQNMRSAPSGVTASILSNGLIYDKNMNPLIINYSQFRDKSDKRFDRVDKRNGKFGRFMMPSHAERWIVVDKGAFMNSKGKDFRVKSRVGYSLYETLVIKRKMVEQIEKIERFLSYLKSLVGQVYDEDNFEILYNLTYNGDRNRTFYLFFQFPNLVLHNSIELTHDIENLVTRITGTHYLGRNEDNSMTISEYLQGVRTKFNPVDAYYGYNHSHLQSYATHIDNFCMGSDHFMSKISTGSYITELEFESLLYGMMDHVAWESLEGGPYTAMESVGQSVGNVARYSNSNIIRTYHPDIFNRILSYIKELDLNELKDAFKLTTQRNREVTYVFDKQLFIKKFLNLVSAEEIQYISEEFEMSYYSYYPADDQFRSNEHDIQSAGSWSRLIKEGLKRVHAIPVIYMNGKHIRPQITRVEKPDMNVKQSMISFHPDVIMYVARIIHYHLLNELKNEKK